MTRIAAEAFDAAPLYAGSLSAQITFWRGRRSIMALKSVQVSS